MSCSCFVNYSWVNPNEATSEEKGFWRFKRARFAAMSRRMEEPCENWDYTKTINTALQEMVSFVWYGWGFPRTVFRKARWSGPTVQWLTTGSFISEMVEMPDPSPLSPVSYQSPWNHQLETIAYRGYLDNPFPERGGTMGRSTLPNHPFFLPLTCTTCGLLPSCTSPAMTFPLSPLVTKQTTLHNTSTSCKPASWCKWSKPTPNSRCSQYRKPKQAASGRYHTESP